jgi:serine/threonine protein kinase/Tfp pilus assembly protein PilF
MIQFTGKPRGGLADLSALAPRNPDVVSTAAPPPDIHRSEAAFELRGGHGGSGELDSWCASYRGGPGPSELFRGAHLTDADLASHAPSAAAVTLPEVGTEFCGFRLVAELGRGAFGRVYLGHQGDLADRPVAVKVSAEIRDESQRLARLQHTNIVPIYSFHRQGPLQAVCMPYFGSATLADVAAELSRRDSLPASGKMVASTVFDCRSRTMRTADSGILDKPAPPVSPTAERPRPAVAAPVTQELKRLEGLTYVESILWIGARLADGLLHAHERGILHRDLKPANVLLTDDGQPMLLDFNLSEDVVKKTDAVTAHIGGTLPYMAPEHLEAFGGTRRDVDARSDIYSLGVIVYELLTGRTPFVRRSGPTETIVPDMIAERRKGAPEVRRFNKAVSPAAEAIVRKCLEPDPARRYQTAGELKEDLERHLGNLPLRYQREPSRVERARKWVRRNPWVRSNVAVATMALAVAATLFGLWLNQKQRTEREHAINLLADFRNDHRTAQSLLYARASDADAEKEGQAAARRALARYELPAKSAWREQLMVRRLPVEQREQLSDEIGQLLVLLAASVVPDHGATDEQKAEALALNRLAEECFGADNTPRALWAQRAELVADQAEANALREQAAGTPLRESWDHYLMALSLWRDKKVAEAVAEAREATRIDPQNFAGWFLLGNITRKAGDRTAKIEATVHYTTCLSLRPDFWSPYLNRGLARFELEEYVAAEADLSRAIELQPNAGESYLYRAHARECVGKYRDALADLEKALANGVSPVRVYLERSTVRERLGDRTGAEQDMAKGLMLHPEDAQGWIARGLAKEKRGEWKGAVSDFAEAAKLDPRSRQAIHNQAYVLGEQLNKPADAIPLLDRELEMYPNQPGVVISRGVYHARVGHRDAALADAKRAAKMAPRTGEILYRAACIYALVSSKGNDPAGDRRHAIAYLARALQSGFGYEYIVSDSDLDPLKADENFAELRKLAEKAGKLQGEL